jgi:uncharacterized protein GlcG (DUF336 family)
MGGKPGGGKCLQNSRNPSRSRRVAATGRALAVPSAKAHHWPLTTKGEAHLNSRVLAAFALFGLIAPAFAQVGTFQTKSITPETALIAAKAAMETCRKQGYQVAVAVVDRSGLTQVFLRDRFAGPHTVELATNKAWTAASFRTSTLALAADTQSGKPMSGLRGVARVATVGGGILIEGGGSIFGAIGVSGAPGGEADDACAQSGVKAIGDAIEF